MEDIQKQDAGVEATPESAPDESAEQVPEGETPVEEGGEQEVAEAPVEAADAPAEAPVTDENPTPAEDNVPAE